MTEAEFGTIQQEGVSRRDVMKRGALVGGAMVWATPIVQTMGSPAFASEGTPEGALSFVAIAYDFDGKTYRFKFNDIPDSCPDHVTDLQCGDEDPNVDCGSFAVPCDSVTLRSSTTDGLSNPPPNVTSCSSCEVTIEMPSGSSNIESVIKCGQDCFKEQHGSTLTLTFNCPDDGC